MIRKLKIFWDKFTTRFAVPLLIVSMVWNTYLGWESRTNARAAEYRLKSYILEHRHLPIEENIYTGRSKFISVPCYEYVRIY